MTYVHISGYFARNYSYVSVLVTATLALLAHVRAYRAAPLQQCNASTAEVRSG